MSSHKHHMLENIQMLRAVAALLVVLHHAIPNYEVMGGSLAPVKHIGAWGFAGVDIFFVISGYIMVYTTMDKPRTLSSAKRFVKHRFFRIYLGYWPFFAIMLLALYLTDPDKLASLDILGSFLLTQTDMFKLVLPVSWSLGYEVYFYLLITLTFLLPARYLKQLMFLWIVGASGIIVTLAWHTPKTPMFYDPFLLEFFAGMLLYLLDRYLIRPGYILPLIMAVLIAYFVGITHEYKNGLWRIFTFGSGAAGVVWIALILERYRYFQAKGLIIDIGNASYTLYLSHLLVLQVFYFVGLRDLFTSPHNNLLPMLGLAAIFVLAIIFSLLYYRYIEHPLYRKAIRRIGEKS